MTLHDRAPAAEALAHLSPRVLLTLRHALFGCFLVIGIAMATWIVRTPSIRDALQASTAQMGWVLFGFSVGSMAGILRAGPLVRRFAPLPVITLGLALALLGLLTVALAVLQGLTWLTAVGLGLVGLGMALSEVAVNILGAEVELHLGRPVLTPMHGCFSLGTAVGALAGLGLVSAGATVTAHLAMVAAGLLLACAVVLWALRPAAAFAVSPVAPGQQAGFFATLRQDRRLLLVGSVVLAMALAEGAANDWLPLIIVDSHGVAESAGSLVFVAFACTMTVGRFGGTLVLARFGPVAVIRASALLAALGVTAVMLSPTVLVAGLAVILWGLGTALGFPVAMSAAARQGGDAAARVSALATVGYLAFLVGPPLLGFVGEHIGLRLTLLVVLALLLVPLVTASSLRPAGTQVGV